MLSQGEVVERYAYDSFGRTRIFDAAGGELTQSAFGNPYMYTGRRYDPETGLYHYRARAYSPDLGRFLQPDPIGYADSMNLYTYCLNNPVNLSDPLGLWPRVGGAGPGDVEWIDYLVKRYNLSEHARTHLHNLITGRGYTQAQLAQEAGELASQRGKWLRSGPNAGNTKSGYIREARRNRGGGKGSLGMRILGYIFLWESIRGVANAQTIDPPIEWILDCWELQWIEENPILAKWQMEEALRNDAAFQQSAEDMWKRRRLPVAESTKSRQ